MVFKEIRNISGIDKDTCYGCWACFNACSKKCITMEADEEGFLHPQVDEGICTQCGSCVRSCPASAESFKRNIECDPQIVAAWNRDDNVRMDSSSGGVFWLLVQDIIAQGGAVFGAAFDNQMVLRHYRADSLEDAEKFRGSKYVQSIVGDMYTKAKVDLNDGRKVLFSGTPCQIAGLYAFLGQDYDNLISVDLVCHGVPSPVVFAAYKESLERKYGAKIEAISFRDKSSGWRHYSIKCHFSNGMTYVCSASHDPFIQGFVSNLFLRRSCYSCQFARIPRVGDISLGDFWGVWAHHPEWDDDQGTSIVMVQTEKGRSRLIESQDQLHLHNGFLEEGIEYNPCICNPSTPNKDREAFFREMGTKPFDKVVCKYIPSNSIIRRLARNAKSLCRKLRIL